MPGKFGSSTLMVAVCTAGWMWNMCPTILVYQGQPYSVSAAAWIPTKPPPALM